MDEDKTKGEKKAEEGKPEEGKADPDAGDKPKEPQVIIDANAAAERLEKANEKKEELMRQEEEIMAKRALGGITEAGQHPVKKEETAKEYKDKVMGGEI